MFGLGVQELGVILLIALIIFGPRKIPEIARSFGKGIREFKNATREMKDEINGEISEPQDSKM